MNKKITQNCKISLVSFKFLKLFSKKIIPHSTECFHIDWWLCAFVSSLVKCLKGRSLVASGGQKGMSFTNGILSLSLPSLLSLLSLSSLPSLSLFLSGLSVTHIPTISLSSDTRISFSLYACLRFLFPSFSLCNYFHVSMVTTLLLQNSIFAFPNSHFYWLWSSFHWK